MTLMTVILVFLSSLGVPGFQDESIQPSDVTPCSLNCSSGEDGGQTWGTSDQGGVGGKKISNGF